MATIPTKPSDIVTTTPADTDSSKNTASAIRSKASATQALITWLQAVIGNVTAGQNDLVTRINTALFGLFKIVVSATDTTDDYLENKILAGSNITITKNNAGANEKLTISASVSASGNTAYLSETVSSGDKLETYYNYSQSRLEARAVKELKAFLADTPYVTTGSSANMRSLINGQYVYLVWFSGTTISAIAGTFDTNYETVTWGAIATATITTPTTNIAICWQNAAKTYINVFWGDSAALRYNTIQITTNTSLVITNYSQADLTPTIAGATAIEIYSHENGYYSGVVVASQTISSIYGQIGNFVYTATTATSVTEFHKIINITGYEYFLLYSKSDGIYTRTLRTNSYSIGTEVAIKSSPVTNASMENIDSTKFIFTYCLTSAGVYKTYARAVAISSTFPYTLTWGTEIYICASGISGTSSNKLLEVIVPKTSHAIIIGNNLGEITSYPSKLNGFVVGISGTTLTNIKSYCLSERYFTTSAGTYIRWLVNNILKIDNDRYVISTWLSTNAINTGCLRPENFNLALAGGSAGANISISPTIRR